MKKRFPLDFRPAMSGMDKVLGKLESQVMEAIWSRGDEVTIRDIYEEIASRRKIAYTTVMTIMGRLAEKSILEKRKTGNISYFRTTMSRREFTDNLVGRVLDSLLDDFTDTTLAHFINRVQEDDLVIIEKLEKMLAARKGSSEHNEPD